ARVRAARGPHPLALAPAPAIAALLPHTHGDLDRGAFKAKGLAQTPFNEPAVLRVQKPRREDHKPRWARRGLSGKQNLGLLSATHRVRMLRDQFTKEGVEAPRRDSQIPTRQR